MTALPVIAGVYRVALNWQGSSGQTAVNVLHFAAPTLTETQLKTQLDTNWAAAMLNGVSSAWAVIGCSITKLDGTSATRGFTLTGAKWTGAEAGEPIPAVSILLSLRTLFRGRQYRGRIYLPAAAESAVSSGVWNQPTAIANSQTAWNSFLTAMTTANCPLVVASYKYAIENAVDNLLVESKVATQRRRQDRVRR